MNSDVELLARRLAEAFRAALADVNPRRLVREALPPRPPKGARVSVIAVGKAAPAMMHGALDTYGAFSLEGLVVTDTTSPNLTMASLGSDPRITWIRGGHPLPDDQSVRAAETALQRVAALGERDLVLALVSGGASALFAAPVPGMTLVQKREVIRELIDRGAPIRDVNVVRRHLSRVKGGQLLAAAGATRVLTLLIGDVIGGSAHDVGSGPTVFDPTTISDASDALRRWLPERATEIGRQLVETQKPAFPLRARWRLLADPDTFASAVAKRLESNTGLRARVLPAEEGEVHAIVARRIEVARGLPPGEAVVVACEPTVRLPPGRGRGGRAGYVGLACAQSLPGDVAFLCAASDGSDGSSGTAGAVVTNERFEGVAPERIAAALADCSDAELHEELGTSLPGGSTGNNLTDVHVLARCSPPTVRAQ